MEGFLFIIVNYFLIYWYFHVTETVTWFIKIGSCCFSVCFDITFMFCYSVLKIILTYSNISLFAPFFCALCHTYNVMCFTINMTIYTACQVFCIDIFSFFYEWANIYYLATLEHFIYFFWGGCAPIKGLV